MSLAAFYDMRDCRSKRWLLAHLDYPHKDWCLIWPFGRKGGGYVAIGSDNLLVHRIVCEYRNGPALCSIHHAAHSCERGHDGCINPWHTSWKTPSENQLDRFQHGPIDEPREKLTVEQVVIIRGLKGIETSDLTAARFGVCESNIRLIQAGKTWKVASQRRIFTRDEVVLITTKPYSKSANEFAEQFGVTKATIEKMRVGQSYRYYSGNVDTRSIVSSQERTQEKT